MTSTSAAPSPWAMDRQSMVDILRATATRHRQRSNPVRTLARHRASDNPDVEKKYGKCNKFDLEGQGPALEQAGLQGPGCDKFLDTPELQEDRVQGAGTERLDNGSPLSRSGSKACRPWA